MGLPLGVDLFRFLQLVCGLCGHFPSFLSSLDFSKADFPFESLNRSVALGPVHSRAKDIDFPNNPRPLKNRRYDCPHAFHNPGPQSLNHHLPC